MSPARRVSYITRFWARVRPEVGDICWIWNGLKDKGGYGRLWISAANRCVQAQRISWEIHYGQIPDGLFVCHKCDVPACVRPDHLFLGTATDNNRDMSRKGRCAPQHCEHNPCSKLTDEQVREIREQVRAGGQRQVDIAHKYGINRSLVSMISNGKRWSKLPASPE